MKAEMKQQTTHYLYLINRRLGLVRLASLPTRDSGCASSRSAPRSGSSLSLVLQWEPRQDRGSGECRPRRVSRSLRHGVCLDRQRARSTRQRMRAGCL